MKQRKEKVETPKFYTLNRILSKNADYNVIFGERSNGKTYATLLYGIKEYLKTGKQMAYIRRWREDLRGTLRTNGVHFESFSSLYKLFNGNKIKKGII